MTLAGTLELVRGFRGRRRRHAGDPDGLLQPDLQLRRRALPRRRQGGRRRRADHRRSAARGGRRALPAGARRGACASSAWRRRPPTTAGCPRCSRTPRASSTTSRSPASPAPARRSPLQVQARGRAPAPPHRAAGRGRLRHPHARAGGRDRRRRRRGRGRLGAGRPDRARRSMPRAAPGPAWSRRCSSRSASSPRASAPPGRLPHELAHRLRPAQDQGAGPQQPARDAGESLGQVPVLRADDLPSRPRDQPARLPALRPSFPGRAGLPVQDPVRRGQLDQDRAAQGRDRPAQVPRPQALRRAAEGGAEQDRQSPMRSRPRMAGSTACRR